MWKSIKADSPRYQENDTSPQIIDCLFGKNATVGTLITEGKIDTTG